MAKKKKLEIPIGARAFGGLAIMAAVLLWGVSQFEGDSAPHIALLAHDSAVVALGKTVYGEQCASCHGPNLEGEPNWRQRKPNGRMPAPPHDINGHTWHHPDIALFKTTKFGSSAMSGGNYRSDMLGYEDILDDEEIIAVLSYIKSTWPEEIIKRHDQMNQQVGERR